jgi:hypothetical protein
MCRAQKGQIGPPKLAQGIHIMTKSIESYRSVRSTTS